MVVEDESCVESFIQIIRALWQSEDSAECSTPHPTARLVH